MSRRDDSRGPLERAYDEEIFPRMAEIIAVAERVGMPIFFHAVLDDDMRCSTAIPVDEHPGSAVIDELREVARPQRRAPLSLTTRDGDGRVTRMTIFAD